MTKKTLAKKIKSFLKPSEPDEDSPELSAVLAKLTERLDALERKTDQILGRLSSLPAEIRNAAQPQFRSGSAPAAQGSQRHSSAPQSQPFQRSAPVTQPVKPLQQVPLTASGVNSTIPSRPGRRDRLLFKAICADCNKDCEVPIKPTEGRPVYCKPCFAVRKAAKTLPLKTPDQTDTAVPVQKMTPSRGQNLHSMPPQTMAPAASIPPVRSAGHVPPQIHNQARRNAVAYLAKKAGHVPSPANAGPQAAPAPAAAVSAGRVPAPKNARPRPVRNERAKPKKRSR